MKFSLSAQTLIGRVLAVAAGRSLDLSKDLSNKSDSSGTTLRFEPEMRIFLEEVRKEAKLATLSAAVTLLLNGVMRASQAEVRGGDLGQESTRIAERVHYLLVTHEISSIDACKLLAPFGVQSSDFRDSGLLFDAIVKNENIIGFMASTFHVSLDWLMARNDRPGETTGWWDKRPGSLCRRVLDLSQQYLRPELLFVCAESADFELAYREGDNVPAQNVTPIIKHKLPGKEIYVYERWDSCRWNYHRSREELKSVMLWAETCGRHANARHIGYRLPDGEYQDLMRGAILPVQALSARRDQAIWYPEDYVTKHHGSKQVGEIPSVKEAFERYELAKIAIQYN